MKCLTSAMIVFNSSRVGFLQFKSKWGSKLKTKILKEIQIPTKKKNINENRCEKGWCVWMVEFLPSALSRSGISFIVGIITIMVTIFIIIRDGFRRKNCCSFGFCPIERGGALPNFFVHFWSIKGIYFLQNANNLKWSHNLAPNTKSVKCCETKVACR